MAGALMAMMVVGHPARAGEWIQVSCVNPDGSAAPSQGWTSFTQGTVTYGEGNDTQCGPGSPMTAYLAENEPVANGQSENLEYVPPAGSTLVGGTLTGTFTAYGGSTYARAAAAVLEPQDTIDQSDAAFLCMEGVGCGGSGDAYAGSVPLPAGRGGTLYVQVICDALGTTQCNQNVGGDNGYWALAKISSADLLLSTAAAPQGTNFSGSILQGTVRGTPHLVLTASDPGGPGVYRIAAAIDGRSMATGGPAGSGTCAPVGSSGGALMFDAQQPCPATAVVDLPIPTTGLAPGPHELTVSVTDAAGDTSTVLDQTISPPQTTPNPRGAHAIHARFVISWRWSGRTTVLRTITVDHLPRAAGVTAACTGRGCPKLHIGHVNAPKIHALLRRLDGRRFRAGDVLHITVTQRHHRAERIRLRFRTGKDPVARLLGP